jgi:hypothetical protein
VANDIDAQKFNLQRHVELLRMRGQLSENDFDHKQAMLKAEGDSIQSAYAVAMTNVARQSALFGDNAAVKQKAEGMITGMTQARDERMDKVIEQRYALMKNAERPVAVAGANAEPTRKEMAEATEKRMAAMEAAGKPTSIAQAQNDAYKMLTGKDRQPGTAEGNYAKPEKGGPGGKISPRIQTRLADADAAEQGLMELDKLLGKGTGFSKADRDKVDQQVEELKKRGVVLPAGSLDFSTNTQARRAGVAQALLGVRNERSALQARATAGGGAEEEKLGPAEQD